MRCRPALLPILLPDWHSRRSVAPCRLHILPISRRGYNIGVRMVDEFLAKASISQCSSFAETADVISKVGFKMFLGVNVEARPPYHPPACVFHACAANALAVPLYARG